VKKCNFGGEKDVLLLFSIFYEYISTPNEHMHIKGVSKTITAGIYKKLVVNLQYVYNTYTFDGG